MTHQATYASPHLVTEPPKGFFPPEVEQWLFDNFYKLQRAVTVLGIVTEAIDVTNTVVETEIGSLLIPPDELHIGEAFILRLAGTYSNASASDDFTLYVKLNGSVIHTISRIGGNKLDAGLDIRYTCTTLTEGASGSFTDATVVVDDDETYAHGETAPHALDTTVVNIITFTFQWVNAKAGNSAQLTQGYVLTLNPVPES